MFEWLVVPLLGALKWMHGYVGNYGWSIILLTILINLVMFPLRHKSVVSMRKMQALQPQLKAIQDRYANLKVTDPARQKMNTEVMNLYREKGVNPASGCVPMLLTMPVLFAFYSLLSQAIELRGAPFGLWIHDLSQPDPYYVIPLLMGATMFWQQRMTPTTADPTQQRMMMFMPIDVQRHLPRLPSGLAIYYFVSNSVADRPAVLHQPGDRRRRLRPVRRRRSASEERGQRTNAGGREQEVATATGSRHRRVNDTLTTQIAAFVQNVVNAMGVTLTTRIEQTPEGTRINLEGEDGGVLVRRGGEGLQALQHLVATAFRKQLGDDNRIVIDCNGFRRDKDAELRQMAQFMAESARSPAPQEMGPLNPYERRIVHLAIAEDPTVSSESIGDAFMKTVIISTKS